MRKSVCVLASLAWSVHGEQLRASTEEIQFHLLAKSSRLEKTDAYVSQFQTYHDLSGRRISKSCGVFAKLLLAFTPTGVSDKYPIPGVAAAAHTPNTASLCPIALFVRNRLGRLSHRMSLNGEQSAIEVIEGREGTKLAFGEIEKPETHRHREYKYMCLENGMGVILTSQPNCDKAAAALCVGVGRLHEPKGTPGLAHFCEHMLFLGTEAFPDEAEYKKFVKGHGGRTNAATGETSTCYQFDIAPDFLGGALDRFSQFFLTPLFTRSATEREINAVDSEHSMRITDDGRRSYATLLLDANPNHPLHWGSGNARSLRDVPRERGSDTHREVTQFYKEHYTSEDMTLAVLGKESLEELQHMVEERFANVSKTGRRALCGVEHGDGEPAIQSTDFSGLILRTPSKDVRQIRFSWQLSEWHVPLWPVKPCAYASFSLGHEGKGSLLSVLKSKGWGTYLSAGASDFGSFSLFDISIGLTEAGLDHVEDIGRLVFSYIRLLQTTAIQPWILKEIQQIDESRFRFVDDMPPYFLATRLARNLQIYPPDKVLSASSKLFEIDLAAASTILDQLTVNGLRLQITAKQFAERCTSTDPWYQGNYLKLELDDKWVRNWESVCNAGIKQNTAQMEASKYGLHLPTPNPFIPENLELRPSEQSEGLAAPVELPAITGVARSFHRQGDSYGQPKAIVAFRFHSAAATESALGVLKCQLWCNAIMEQMNEYAYDAQSAGLSYQLSATRGGFELSVAGFSDKLPVLLRAVLQKMRTSSAIPPTVFDIVHDRFERNLKNQATKQRPCDLAARRAYELRQNIVFPVEERLPLLKNLTVEDLQGENDKLFQTCYTNSLLMGNLDVQDAEALAGIVAEELGDLPSACDLPDFSEAQLPAGYTVWEDSGTDIEERNNAVRLEMQIPLSLRNSVLVSLLVRVLNPKFFESLRTKQQLGYIVSMTRSENRGFLEIAFAIQSEYEPDYLRSRIDNFLEEYLPWIERELDQEEFERQRQGLVSNLKEEPQNLREEFSQRWAEIALRRYDFNRREASLSAMEAVTLADLQAFVGQVVRSAPRLYVQVHSISESPPKLSPEAIFSAASPNRLWKGSEARETFRESADWVSEDWSSNDTFMTHSS